MLIEYFSDSDAYPLTTTMAEGGSLSEGRILASEGHFSSAEDIYYPQYTKIIIGQLCVFKNDLRHKFGDAIAVSKIVQGDVWSRDSVVRTSWGISYLCPGAYQNFLEQSKQHSYLKDVSLLETISAKKRLFENIKRNYSSKTSYELYENLLRVLFPNLKEYPSIRLPGLHLFPIAGGNTISGRRFNIYTKTQEQFPTAIIGKNSAVETAFCLNDNDLNHVKLIDPNYDIVKKDDLFEHMANTVHARAQRDLYDQFIKRYRAAKALLRHWFYGPFGMSLHHGRNIPMRDLSQLKGLIPSDKDPQVKNTTEFQSDKKQVIFVDQWAYHIDLQMAYIGLGVVLVHDFGVSADFLNHVKSNYHLISDILKDKYKRTEQECRLVLAFYRFCLDNYSKANMKMIVKAQPIVEKICTTLTKSGFFPIRVCGVLFPNSDVPLLNGMINPTKSPLDYLAHSCMNLIACTPAIINRAGESIARFDLLIPSQHNGDPLLSLMWQDIEARVQRVMLRANFQRTELAIHHVFSHKFNIDMTEPKYYFANGGRIQVFYQVKHGTPQMNTASSYMILLGGGLRCQTMLVSEHDVETLTDPQKPSFAILEPEKIWFGESRKFFICTSTPNYASESDNSLQSKTSFFTYKRSADEPDAKDMPFGFTLLGGLELSEFPHFLKELNLPIPKNYWVPDLPACPQCNILFTLINRRHHCRVCGNLICARCGTKAGREWVCRKHTRGDFF